MRKSFQALSERDGMPITVACIPAYNEEKTIARVVLQVQKYVDKVIVCDDGSHDMTGEIAASLGATVLRHESNMGKGATLRTLFEASRKMGAKVIVTIDGDGQHDPSEVPMVARPVLEGNADICIGTRLHEKNSIPVSRQVGNKLLTLITNFGSTRKIIDTQSGFRAYSSQALEKIVVREEGMGVDSQILKEADKNNLRIAESLVSVNYEDGRSKRNPLGHLANVILSTAHYAAEERPLLLLGVPGLIALGVGLIYGLLALAIYTETKQFIFAYALLAVGATLMGAFAILIALVLYTLASMFRRLRSQYVVRVK